MPYTILRTHDVYLFAMHGTAPLELVAVRLAHSGNSLAPNCLHLQRCTQAYSLLPSVLAWRAARLILAQRMRNSKFFFLILAGLASHGCHPGFSISHRVHGPLDKQARACTEKIYHTLDLTQFSSLHFLFYTDYSRHLHLLIHWKFT